MVSGGAWHCQLFAIDVKGGGKRQEEERKSMPRKSIAINAKGGDCWKCLTGNICLSLMASIAMKMACIQEECTKDYWHVLQDDRQTKDKVQRGE